MKTVIKNLILVLPLFMASCTPKEQPYLLSPAAQSMIQSYRELISKAKSTVLCNAASPRNVYVTQSAMLTKYLYPGDNGSGFLTFPSFYIATGDDAPSSDKRRFYTSFSFNSYKGYTYNFGECAKTAFPTRFAGDADTDTTKLIYKMPVVYPLTQYNEVFSLQVIPVEAYKTYRNKALTDTDEGKDFAAAGGFTIAIAPADMEEIQEAYIEAPDDYMGSKQKESYNRMESSKGVIINVKVKGKAEAVKCYLINNYDEKFLVWKIPNFRG